MHLFVVIVLFVVAGTVYSESCASTAQCHNHGSTHCEHHTHVFCDNRINQCICASDAVQNGQVCQNVGTCPDCSNGRHKHCVDGHCVCFVI